MLHTLTPKGDDGGSVLPRDEGPLLSALAGPRNMSAYLAAEREFCACELYCTCEWDEGAWR